MSEELLTIETRIAALRSALENRPQPEQAIRLHKYIRYYIERWHTAGGKLRSVQ